MRKAYPRAGSETHTSLIRVGVDAPAREGTPILKVAQEKQESNENENEAGVGAGSGGTSVLDELARDAAQQMLAVALQPCPLR